MDTAGGIADKEARETILVMDDDEDVRFLVDYMLRHMGFAVECAADGITAIELCRQRLAEGCPYRAVILDLNIPGGLGGREVVARLRELTPEPNAFVSSGYPDDPCMRDCKDYGFVGAIAKPITYDGIRSTILPLLETGSGCVH